MSYENVKKYFESVGLKERVFPFTEVGATVEQAASTIGCEPAMIAKTMSFLVDDKPILIVSAGDAKINSSKFKSHFHQKAVMIPGDLVENYIGHAPGGVCPFALNEGVQVFLDISLRRFNTIYTAGGDFNNGVKLSLDELTLHSSSSEWIDVCKGWFINENEQ